VIRWITEQLGTAPASEVIDLHDVCIVDVRDLVDKRGNSVVAIKNKIDQGVQFLKKGHRVIICCDYGISRSNAVAAGVLAVHKGISFLEAVRIVQQRTRETEIKPELLKIVGQAVGNLPLLAAASRQTVLITGGGGFIGTALRTRLAADFDIVCPARSEIDLLKGATQLDLLTLECGAQTIIHLAMPRVYNSNTAAGQSITMLRNVLDVAASRQTRLIYLSSWEVFSGYAGELWVDEEVPLFSKGPYGDAKLLSEALIQNFKRSHQLNCAIARASPVYGPGSDRPKFVYNFLDKAVRGETIVTHRYLNGDAMLDLLHINDLVDGLTRLIYSSESGVFHFGTGKLTSTFEIASYLCRTVGSTSQVTRIEVETHAARIAMKTDKAKTVLGWEAKVDVWAGLADLAQIKLKG